MHYVMLGVLWYVICLLLFIIILAIRIIYYDVYVYMRLYIICFHVSMYV